MPSGNPSPDTTPSTTLCDVRYFCSPSRWGPQRPMQEGGHWKVGTYRPEDGAEALGQS